MVLLDLSGPRRSNPVLSGPRQEGEGEGELDIDTASTKRVPSPRQRVLAWLRTKGAAAPSGWANGSLNEMLGVYGADAVIGCWEGASPEVKTSRQFVQLAERELSPALFSKPKSTAKGFGPSAEEARNAFRR